MLCILWVIPFFLNNSFYLFSDDAYYYFTIARNVWDAGYPTFDRTTPTNGFHPLWLAVLLPIFGIADTAFTQLFVVRVLEFVIASATLIIAYLATSKATFASRLTFLLLSFIVLKTAGLNGMETTLAMFLFALIYWRAGLFHPTNGTIRLDRVGYFFLSLLFLARLDTALFVAPIVCFDVWNALCNSTLRQKIRALSGKLVCLALLPSLYLISNLYYFDVPFPVSGSVKAVGAFGINGNFLAQLSHGGEMLRPRLNFPNFAILLVVLTAAIFFGHRGGGKMQWLIAAVLGAWAFLGYQLLWSKWSAWAWYLYAAFPLLWCGFDYFLTHARKKATTEVVTCALLLGALYNLSVYSVKAYTHAPSPHDDFRIFNIRLAAELNERMPGRRIAMGDRAGSFAFFYNGAVFQLEGLVQDAAYLTAIRQHAVPAFLQHVGIDYLMSYERLGPYSTAEIENPRSALSTGPITRIKVCRAREVAVWPTSSQGLKSTSAVHLWRWPPC